MVRPKCCCKIKYHPKATEFGPRGVGSETGETIILTPEEAETLRLKDVKGMEQVDAAKHMGVSQSTFQRMLASARKKTSTALIKGNTLKITKN